MTEPEVRDAYGRIHTTRATIDVRERELIEPELKQREKADESILVTPLYGDAGLVDPRRISISDLRDDVQAAFQREGADFAQGLAFALKLQSDGYRATAGGSEEIPWVYLAVLKSGLIHWSFNEALMRESAEQKVYDYESSTALYHMLETLVLARLVYERAGYRGPVRVHYRLRAPGPFIIDRRPLTIHPTAVPAGTYPAGPVETYLQGGLAQIVKELLDPIFQAAGKAAAPWFDANGNLVEEKRKGLPSTLADHLD
jgi:hypothetical protein